MRAQIQFPGRGDRPQYIAAAIAVAVLPAEVPVGHDGRAGYGVNQPCRWTMASTQIGT
jgi:hypothetical protein